MNYILKGENMSYTISSRGAEIVSAKNALGEEFIWQADESF